MSRDISDDETVIMPEGGDPLVGRTIGNYKVLAVLGRGGFGSVYKAKDLKLGRAVALKFLNQAGESMHAELFEREAKALGALSKHNNIVQIHAWDEFEGKNFFVLEYMPLSAFNLLREFPDGLPIDMATRIVAECADALQFAHDSEILHRDIKAQNILLEDKNGAAKIADFGLARICGSSSNTIEGAAFGSPAYMAPEQARGQQLTNLCDIYSLGVTLYELLCGKPAVSGSSVLEMIEKVKNNDRIPLRTQKPDLPAALYAIVDKATAMDPRMRYQSASEMAADLRDLDSVSVATTTALSGGWLGAFVGAAALLMVLGGIGYAMMSPGNGSVPAEPTQDVVQEPIAEIEPIEDAAPDNVAAEEPVPLEPETPPVVAEADPTLTEQAKEVAKEEGEKILREKAEDVAEQGEQLIKDTIKDILTGDSGGSNDVGGGGPGKGNPGKGKGNSKKKD